MLLAFTAAQLAVVRLRRTQPDLRRPFRVPLNVRMRGVAVPIPSIVGALLTARGLRRRDGDAHRRALRRPGVAPRAESSSTCWCRRSQGAGLLEHVVSADEHVLPPEAEFSRILVPMKLGEIGEEMVATAVKLAEDSDAVVEAVFVIKVPLDQPLDAPLVRRSRSRPPRRSPRPRALGPDHGVEVVGRTVRARALGDAIVDGGRRERVRT